MSRRPFIERTPVTLDILDVIDAERVKTMSTKELADLSRDLIRARIDRAEK